MASRCTQQWGPAKEDVFNFTGFLIISQCVGNCIAAFSGMRVVHTVTNLLFLSQEFTFAKEDILRKRQ